MAHLKFDVAKLEKLNDPGRFETLKPDVMWAALGSPEPSTVVDLGAGTGLFSARFSELAPGAVVYAADMEPLMIEWMTQNRPEVAAGRVVPVLSSETEVPLEDRFADLVIMVNLHHELADKPAAYAEAYRMLRPGGQLLAVDWAPRETPKGPPMAVRESPEEVITVLERVGFSDASSHGGLPWSWLVTARRPANE